MINRIMLTSRMDGCRKNNIIMIITDRIVRKSSSSSSSSMMHSSFHNKMMMTRMMIGQVKCFSKLLQPHPISSLQFDTIIELQQKAVEAYPDNPMLGMMMEYCRRSLWFIFIWHDNHDDDDDGMDYDDHDDDDDFIYSSYILCMNRSINRSDRHIS